MRDMSQIRIDNEYKSLYALSESIAGIVRNSGDAKLVRSFCSRRRRKHGIGRVSTAERVSVNDRPEEESIVRHWSYCSPVTFLTVITVTPNARPPSQKSVDLGTSF